jgi:hypothetical protein
MLPSGDERHSAMFTNCAAQPSTVGEHGMVCAMLLCGRSSCSSINNGIYDTYHVYKKLRQCMHKQLLGDGVDVMIHCLEAGDVSVVRESTVAASATPHHHITHHAMFTNSAWLCNTIDEHGKTLITTMDGVNNPSVINNCC